MAKAPEPGKKSEAAGGKGGRNAEGRRDTVAAAAGLSHADRVPAGILFGDMKGSTASAERAEFEAVGVIRDYLRLIETTVRSFSPHFFKVKSEATALWLGSLLTCV